MDKQNATKVYNQGQLHGLVTHEVMQGPHFQVGPELGLMLCCGCLEVLHYFEKCFQIFVHFHFALGLPW